MDIVSPSWMHELIHTYGLVVLFTVVMLECMGVLMPGETALVTAALYAGSTHRFSIASVVLVATTAAIIGETSATLSVVRLGSAHCAIRTICPAQ